MTRVPTAINYVPIFTQSGLWWSYIQRQPQRWELGLNGPNTNQQVTWQHRSFMHPFYAIIKNVLLCEGYVFHYKAWKLASAKHIHVNHNEVVSIKMHSHVLHSTWGLDVVECRVVVVVGLQKCNTAEWQTIREILGYLKNTASFASIKRSWIIWLMELQKYTTLNRT